MSYNDLYRIMTKKSSSRAWKIWVYYLNDQGPEPLESLLQEFHNPIHENPLEEYQ